MFVAASNPFSKQAAASTENYTMCLAVGELRDPLIGGILHYKLGHSAAFVSAYALVGLNVIFRALIRRKIKLRSV